MEKEEKDARLGLPVVLVTGLGLALACSQEGFSFLGMPLFAGLVLFAFVIQWIAFIFAYAFQTEKFFDMTGSLTYITVTALAALLSPVRDARSWLLMLLILIWAARLGSFLFARIHRAGKDGRFDDIKPSFFRFLLTWSLQGLWVVFTSAAALTAITTSRRMEPDIFLIAGLLIWMFGFTIEVIADSQKNRFRSEPSNTGKFIQSGLWSKSRHPNYFGEIVLWLGIAVIALPVLRGWQWAALISPVFVTLLLTQISGIPMLEKRADARWGGQADYEDYKNRTPVLIPKLFD